MNKMFIAAIAFTSILASCSQGKAPVAANEYKNKIVLGAYSDMFSYSTLDESQLTDLPKLVDLSADMTPAKNQADRGTCTFFSVIGLVEGAIKKDLGKEVNLSEEYLNYAAKKSGPYQQMEGSIVEDNVRGMRTQGLLLEEDWSYQASWFEKGRPCGDYKASDRSAPKTCFTHNKPNKKAMSRLIDARGITVTSIPKDTNAIIRFLAEKKRPLIMSVNVNFNAWPNTGETDFNEEYRNECLTTPSDCGGHSIILTGYDMEKRVFMFKNSWGKDWGKNGYGTIPFDVVDVYVNEVLYYAEVPSEVKLPEGKSPEIKLQKFDVETYANEDKSISIAIDSEVDETSGKMLYISSYLVKKSKNYVAELPSDGNTELVRLSVDEKEATGEDYVRVSTVTVPKEENQIAINSTETAGLALTAEMFSLPSIDALLGNPDYDKFLRTTIYVHTDDSTFKVLKRVYTPVQ
ncbi:C1 family peptidase [Bacteriovorax sp. PP10]|uniref:C1 family peptidase n=1 Tax=Bacteriovorax antarcticus TaxID=3088717 RepID=A0ABU5VVE7_9BACT|nr:C1 family peptidase [Bacteriovorax sp. PP10]MEA9357022.1 C1 family peptidase [Bacteriovorax sp. PP10]